MFDLSLVWDWLEFAVRWLHVIAGIAWIGSSFYFIALDLGLTRSRPLPEGVLGEEWQVHGGGFYHIQKYMVAPDHMPDHLTWFKWEAYWTFISGLILLALVYWLGADLFLVDYDKIQWAPWQAIAISAGSLTIGWICYDLLCRSPLGRRPTVLMLILFAIIVAMAWGYTQVFTGRAALLHLGAFTGTIMVANVFLVIMPNQRIVVADLKAGRQPDPKYGTIAKLRSTHNNYLTLPVIFLMLSNHYPLAFASPYNWLIASLVFLMGVTIRHFFNSMHARKGRLWWTWAATAALFAAIVALSLWPTRDMAAPEAEAALPAPLARVVASAGFGEVQEIVESRCAMCHTAEPLWPGLGQAPKGVQLDSAPTVARHARQIYRQAGLTHAMPPGNVMMMPPEERARIVEWYRALEALAGQM
ncbi:urate hydroxylase PuuD [Rhodovulum sulfidophilum]|uniref:urate hydroxylase PuuD n=1 Tax=Rhodovulum sulfidophilum TaxID=35806 RepID=UPI001921891F|nr:urate hydroxylase PuuD [Rhodovulum sulfidophilum]MBL3575707.1 urate hydroxylase PuuD [Rhodovulum sulfidophilum]MCF4117583.1 urate hydroxylase PuuD [Rhodovulum sulfidophilum]